MKRLAVLFSLTAAAAAAWANPIANMQAQCRCVHADDVCRVDNSRRMKEGTRRFISGGIIEARVYNSIQDLGDGMCADIPKACSTWDGERCKAYRLMFRQTPIDCAAYLSK